VATERPSEVQLADRGGIMGGAVSWQSRAENKRDSRRRPPTGIALNRPRAVHHTGRMTILVRPARRQA